MIKDEVIIKELSSGKISTYEYLFNRYYTSLCAFARKYLNDKNEAEDVVCSLFVHLWEIRSNLSITTSVEAYLITSVHNKCLNKIRGNLSRRKRDEIFYNSCNDNMVPQEDKDAETKIDHEIINRIIKNVSQNLPARCNEILRLSREENLNYKEISQKLNISIGTVKTQIFRANKKIKEALKGYTFSLFL